MEEICIESINIHTPGELHVLQGILKSSLENQKLANVILLCNKTVTNKFKTLDLEV